MYFQKDCLISIAQSHHAQKNDMGNELHPNRAQPEKQSPNMTLRNQITITGASPLIRKEKPSEYPSH